MTTEGIDVRSVGNSLLLHETSLVEAFNLKAAIEYTLKNFDAATEALTDMPPRDESELDPVSLHNQVFSLSYSITRRDFCSYRYPLCLLTYEMALTRR